MDAGWSEARPPRGARGEEPARLAERLRRRIRGDVRDDAASRDRASRDRSPFRVRPSLVVVAAADEDVEATVRVCAEAGVPIAVRGGGTGLAGQSIGPGVVLDVGALPAIIEVEGEGETVRAGAAATVDEVNAALAPFGRRLGPDLTSSDKATVGGIVATNAAGAASNRYGRTARSLLEVEAVLGTGERVLLGLGRPAPDGVPSLPVRGGDLPRDPFGYGPPGPSPGALLAGSEGTLGVILSARLETFAVRPRAVEVLAFPDVRAAVEAVPDVLAADPVAVELLDRSSLRSRWRGDPGAVLIVEVEGDSADEAAVALAAARAGSSAPAALQADPTSASGDAGEAAWRLRRSVLGQLPRADGRRPTALIEDACVPVARLPALVDGLSALSAALGVGILVYGHAAAGTLHPRPLLDLRRPEHRAAATRLIAEHADLVHDLGGTISAEHGLGLARTWLVARDVPPETLTAWRTVKRALDPAGILNPGRVVPDDDRFPAELLVP